MHQKLYIVVKDWLTPAQKTVQACHAVEAWALDDKFFCVHAKHGDVPVHTKVLLEVSDQDFEKLKLRLTMRSEFFTVFKEPDLDNRETALACPTDSNVFGGYKMIE